MNAESKKEIILFLKNPNQEEGLLKITQALAHEQESKLKIFRMNPITMFEEAKRKEEVREEQTHKMKAMAGKLADMGIETNFEIIFSSNIYDAFRDKIKNSKSELVLAGYEGKFELEKRNQYPVAKLIKIVPNPIGVVKNKKLKALNKIAVPIIEKSEWKLALRSGMELANFYHSELFVFGSAETKESLREKEKEIHTILDKVTRRLGYVQVNYQLELLSIKALIDNIVDRCREYGVDLLVLGSEIDHISDQPIWGSFPDLLLSKLESPAFIVRDGS